MKFKTVTVIALLLNLITSHAYSNNQARGPHINVELLSLHSQISQNGKTKLGILFRPDPGWHVYWKNPGDTGLSPTLTWSTPDSVSISKLSWPFPENIKVAHLTNYGFHDPSLLIAELEHTSNTNNLGNNKSGAPKPNDINELVITAKLDWLVCKESCIPGEAELSLSIPIGDTNVSNTASQQIFDQGAAHLPKDLPILSASANITPTSLDIAIFAQSLVFKNAKTLDVFIENLDLVRYDDPIKVTWFNNHLTWKQTLSEFFQSPPEDIGAVIVVDNKQAFNIRIPTTQ